MTVSKNGTADAIDQRDPTPAAARCWCGCRPFAPASGGQAAGNGEQGSRRPSAPAVPSGGTTST